MFFFSELDSLDYVKILTTLCYIMLDPLNHARFNETGLASWP
jgi:hypothetical protein